MADQEDSSDPSQVIFPIGEPEDSDHWFDSVSAYDEDLDFNPFASVSFDCRSSGPEWLADSDSDSDRDISCFVTDLFDRRCHSSDLELEREGSEVGGVELDGLRIASLESESDCEDVGDRAPIGDLFDWVQVEESENSATLVAGSDESEAPATAESELLSMLEAMESFEREIMIAINTLASNASLERESSEDYALVGAEHDALLLDQFVDAGAAVRIGPPAAKEFVEKLLVVEPKVAAELGKEGVACAVCKDTVSAIEPVNKLPCCHYFHSECIAPWLGIRNTCPVCRFEVPTDDPDYERWKSRRAVDSQQVYANLELFS